MLEEFRIGSGRLIDYEFINPATPVMQGKGKLNIRPLSIKVLVR